MKTKFLALGLILAPFIFSSPASAQYITAQPCSQLVIEKKILNPQNNQFVNSLNLDQHVFLPDQDITFRISVTNNTSGELKNLSVTDKLPDVLKFVSTSFGSFDANSNILTLTIDSLKVGETKTFELKGKVKPSEQLPASSTCQTNLAKVMVNNLVCEATSSFCSQRKVMEVTKEIPVTGPADTAGFLVLSALTLAISLLIKRILYLERR